MSEAITIGIDHGYAAMKTKSFSVPTGLVGKEKCFVFMAA